MIALFNTDVVHVLPHVDLSPEDIRSAEQWGISYALVPYSSLSTSAYAAKALKLMEAIYPRFRNKIYSYCRNHVFSLIQILQNTTQRVEFCARLALLYPPKKREELTGYILSDLSIAPPCPRSVLINLGRLRAEEGDCQGTLHWLVQAQATEDEYLETVYACFRLEFFDQGLKIWEAFPEQQKKGFASQLARGLCHRELLKNKEYAQELLELADNEAKLIVLIKAYCHCSQEDSAYCFAEQIALKTGNFEPLMRMMEYTKQKSYFPELIGTLSKLKNPLGIFCNIYRETFFSPQQVMQLCSIFNDVHVVLKLLWINICRIMDDNGEERHKALPLLEEMRRWTWKTTDLLYEDSWSDIVKTYAKLAIYEKGLETCIEFYQWTRLHRVSFNSNTRYLFMRMNCRMGLLHLAMGNGFQAVEPLTEAFALAKQYTAHFRLCGYYEATWFKEEIIDLGLCGQGNVAPLFKLSEEQFNQSSIYLICNNLASPCNPRAELL